MKRIILFTVVLQSLVTYGLTQQVAETVSQALSKQMLEQLKLNNFEEAILTGKKVIQIATTTKDADPKNLSIANANLARAMTAYYTRALEKTSIGQIERKRRSEILLTFPSEIESLYRSAIKIQKEKVRGDQMSTISLQFELTGFISNQGKSVTRNGTEYDKAKVTYTDALDNLKRLVPAGDDAAIAGTLTVANFFQTYAEFERSFPLYQDFLQRVESKMGLKAIILVPALREIAEIQVIIGNSEQAAASVKRISEIIGKDEKPPEASFDLSRRSVDDWESKMMADPGTITSYLKTLKTIKVSVEIDERGRVIDAKAEPNDEVDIKGKKVRDIAENQTLSWRFRPLALTGEAKKMRGTIRFPYLVKAK